MQETWVGKIPGEGKGCPLQYTGLENAMGYTDYTVHGVMGSQTPLSAFHFQWASTTGTPLFEKIYRLF